jgi:hypothetical protein
MDNRPRSKPCSTGSGSGPRQRAGDIFRRMLLVFTIGFIVLAIVAGILTKELGIVVVPLCTYVLMVIFALCCRRLLMQDLDDE